MLRNVCRLAKCAISKVNTKMKAERLHIRRKFYRAKDDRLSLRRYVVFMCVAILCSKCIMCF